jgi:uncharacterized damage-inducible protein DinB
MTVIESLSKQLAHAAWANAAHLDALAALTTPPPRAMRWIAHVLAAEELWLERLRQSGRAVTVWPDLTLDECRRLAERTAAGWRDLLRDLTPERLAISVPYFNSKGERWENTVHDVLLHVCLHGAHHRGQIIAEIRATGGEPPYTDYIHAVRQGFIA